MIDAIPQRDLAAHTGEINELRDAIARVCSEHSVIAVAVAAAIALVDAAEQADLDADAVLAQVQEAVERGEIDDPSATTH